MSLAIIVGWTLLVAEAVVVIAMFIGRDAGDDAAGRGVSRALSLLAGAALVVAGSLFWWGQQGGPTLALVTGLALMAIPLASIAWTLASRPLRRLDLVTGHAHFRAFGDARLTRLAKAIETNDLETVRAVIADGPIDFSLRNRSGRTILGVAVEHALQAASGPVAVDAVRCLIAAGAKPLPNVIRADAVSAEPDAHLLVAHVFTANGSNALALLDVLLEAGADPNTRNHEGRPLYLEPFLTRPKLEVLARHGADFSALDTREDRAGWTAAMVAAHFGNADLVQFFRDRTSGSESS